MRTVDDALTYIDAFISRCLEQPEMYAANPVALEEVLTVLDNLAAFLRSDDQFPVLVNRSRYAEFIKSKGYGAESFTCRLPDAIAVERDRAAFEPLCAFWREYLSVRDKPPPFSGAVVK
jgi:hypothetical protein